MSLFEPYDGGFDTTVLMDLEGNIAEGPGFNVFAVRDGELPSPESGVLDGMTRTTVFDLASELNLSARLARLTPAALRGAGEVFICSTAGGIMPVRRVDDAPIGDGMPGPTTRRLEQLYWRKRKSGWLSTPVRYD